MLAGSSAALFAGIVSSSSRCIDDYAVADIIARRDDYYYDEEDEYSQRQYREPAVPGRRARTKPDYSGVLDILKNQRQLGAILLGIGFLLTLMGMMLFFEGNLLRLGNICLIAGIPLLIGPNRVSGYFLKKERMQATIITAFGILLVFIGKPRLGLLIEIFGLLNLFGNMFPLLLALGKRMPIVGDFLSMFDEAASKKSRPPRREGPARSRYPAQGEPIPRKRYGNYDPDF